MPLPPINSCGPVAADQRRVAADGLHHGLARQLIDGELAAGDRGVAEGAMDRGPALDNHRVVARAKIDRVVAAKPVLLDDARAAEVDCIVAATDGDAAILADVDLVVARPGLDRAVLADGQTVITVADNDLAVLRYVNCVVAVACL